MEEHSDFSFVENLICSFYLVYGIHLCHQESPDYVRELIRKTRTLTNKPFGIGVVLAFPHEENVKVILEEKVAVLQVYWGECSSGLVQEAHRAGVKVVPQVITISTFPAHN